jgi:hypothetical protein
MNVREIQAKTLLKSSTSSRLSYSIARVSQSGLA